MKQAYKIFTIKVMIIREQYVTDLLNSIDYDKFKVRHYKYFFI